MTSRSPCPVAGCALRKSPFDGPRIGTRGFRSDPGGATPVYRGDTCVEVFSPDGTLLATGGYGGTAALWDVESLDPLSFIDEAHAGAITAWPLARRADIGHRRR